MSWRQVSAGYDAHWRDPLAGLQFTTATYNRLARDVRALADRLCRGRIAFFLEVGHHDANATAAFACLRPGLLTHCCALSPV